MDELGNGEEELPDVVISELTIVNDIPDTERIPLVAEEVQPTLPPQTNSIKICFNLINSTLGAGILTLPYALRSSGMIFGCVLLPTVAIISGYTAVVIMRLSRSGITSYTDMGTKVFKSKVVGSIFEFCLLIMTFGTCSGYSVIIGEYVSSIVLGYVTVTVQSPLYLKFLTSEGFAGFVIILVIIFPLSLFRKLTFLAYSSFLGLIAVFFVVLLITIKFFELGMRPIEKIDLMGNSFSKITAAFPLYIFAYSNHVPFINLLNELRGNIHSGKIGYVIFITNTFATCLYFAISILGYLLFGRDIKDNILMSFQNDDITAQVGKGIIVFVICCSYPIYSFALREAITNLFFSCKKFERCNDEEQRKKKYKPPGERIENEDGTTTITEEEGLKKWERGFEYTRHFALSVFIVAGTFLLGVLVPIVSVVLGFTAAVAYTCVNYLIPLSTAIVHDKRLWTRITNSILFVLMFALGCVSTIGVAMEYLSQEFGV